MNSQQRHHAETSIYQQRSQASDRFSNYKYQEGKGANDKNQRS